MKALGAAGAATFLILASAWAWGGEPVVAPAPARPAPTAGDWTIWPSTGRRAEAQPVQASVAEPAEPEIDVVDAHWMALTMWGEARGQGEEAMRAVGHVIDNRRRAGMHGTYATDQVGERFQFSCWNPGDPNRAAMLAVDSLPPDTEEARMWRIARRIAAEILAGRSADPTAGALFYHTVAVAPSWSRGIAPVRRIGSHLFFRAVRQPAGTAVSSATDRW